MTSAASVSISSCITIRTASRIKFTPSPARNASSNADRSDYSRDIGSISFDAYLPVHTENHADGPTRGWTLPATSNPTTRRDAYLRRELQTIGESAFRRSYGMGED